MLGRGWRSSIRVTAAAAQKPHADDPGRVLAGIHLALADALPPAHFVTAAYVHVDLDRRTLRYASAGHPPRHRGGRGVQAPRRNGTLDDDCTLVAVEIGERSRRLSYAP